jgi:hypothetical protein
MHLLCSREVKARARVVTGDAGFLHLTLDEVSSSDPVRFFLADRRL